MLAGDILFAVRAECRAIRAFSSQRYVCLIQISDYDPRWADKLGFQTWGTHADLNWKLQRHAHAHGMWPC